VLGSLRILRGARLRGGTPPLPRRGERAITPAPTVASPGAAARLGPLGAILHSWLLCLSFIPSTALLRDYIFEFAGGATSVSGQPSLNRAETDFEEYNVCLKARQATGE